MTAWDTAIGHVLQAEGGYVDNPRDPGGETNFGISKRAYPALDIRALTPEAATAIYRRDYWDACQCDKLPGPVAVVLFDAAVNQGVGAAVRMLQHALRVAEDGAIGVQTLDAVAHRGTVQLAKRLMALRIKRYAATANWDTFADSWLARCMDCLEAAVRL